MAVTDTFSLRYPTLGDSASGITVDFEHLAEDADNTLANSVRAAIQTILGNVKGITVGFVQLTAPAGGGTVTQAISGLTTPGTNFMALTNPQTADPQNVRTSASAVTGTGFTFCMNRNNDTTTGCAWVHIGYA